MPEALWKDPLTFKKNFFFFFSQFIPTNFFAPNTTTRKVRMGQIP
jgi:hypothetical protein